MFFYAYVMCTLHFVMVYCMICDAVHYVTFLVWKLYILELFRCVQLRFVTLHHVTFTLRCFTLCSNTAFSISKPVYVLPPEGNIEGLGGVSRPFRPVSKPNPGHASIFSRNHRAASFRNLAAIQDSKLERGLKYVVFSLTPEKWCTTNSIFRVCIRNG